MVQMKFDLDFKNKHFFGLMLTSPLVKLPKSPRFFLPSCWLLLSFAIFFSLYIFSSSSSFWSRFTFFCPSSFSSPCVILQLSILIFFLLLSPSNSHFFFFLLLLCVILLLHENKERCQEERARPRSKIKKRG